jgi:hypothetical protein
VLKVRLILLAKFSSLACLEAMEIVSRDLLVSESLSYYKGLGVRRLAILTVNCGFTKIIRTHCGIVHHN